MTPTRSVVAVAMLSLMGGAVAADFRQIPLLSGPVVDEAALLSESDRARIAELARRARAAEGGAGVQLQMLIVPSLQGEAIEDFSIRVAEAWKLGTKGKDNGLLVVVSRDDRKVRIEVGGGIEGGLTDAQAGRIIRNTIVPAFRAERYGEGLYAAGQQALSAVGALPASERRQPPQRPTSGRLPASIILLVFIIGFFLLRLIGLVRPQRRGFGRGFLWGTLAGMASSGLGRGGRFGSDGSSGWGGGGGWSGGGGGFSGGGASGNW